MRRGQEEAPVELLIAVTVLTFVLIIGFVTYKNLCSSQFEQKLNSVVAKFARDIELVYKGASGTSWTTMLDFSLEGCPGATVESVRILKGDPDTCLSQTGKPECLVIAVVYITSDQNPEKYAPLQEVIDVPADTSINYIRNQAALQEMGCGEDMINALQVMQNGQKYFSMNQYGFDQLAEEDIEKYIAECTGWALRPYNLRISKTSFTAITIEEMGAP
jgi:hypothetical protein